MLRDSVPQTALRAAGSSGSAAGGEASGDVAAAQRLEALQRNLEAYRRAYFAEGKPLVSDDVYDALQREVEALQRQLGGQDEGDASEAATARPVGAPVLEALRKARHGERMLSLAAVQSAEELRMWLTRVRNHLAAAEGSSAECEEGAEGGALAGLGASRWVVEPKVDGLAVRLTYRGGALQQAATRGDGAEGEDVTHNALQIPGVLASVAPTRSGDGGLPSDFEVRGEVYMTKEAYAQVNRAQVAAGEEPFANPRNAAAGSLRLLDAAASRERRLSFVAYQLLAALPGGGALAPLRATHWENLQCLASAGFPVSSDNRLADSFEDAVAAAGAWMAGRAALPYEADGVVLKVDRLDVQQALGSVGADPRWAVAWKFPAEQTVTRLLAIEMSLGRTGRLTPIAVLEPVAIGGVTVARASLHNVGLVRKKGVKVGDHVVLERAGDVIPQVLWPLAELRTGGEADWEMPTDCPSCGGAVTVVSEKDADVAFCLSGACPGQVERLVQHYAATCVHGIGKATVSQLIASGCVRDVADLYERVTEERLLELDGYQATRAAAHVAAIAGAKGLPLQTLLVALAIPLVGPKAAERLAQAHGSSLARLAAASEEDLLGIPGFGPHMAASVVQWMAKESNQRLLARLQALDVVAPPPSPPSTAAAPGADLFSVDRSHSASTGDERVDGETGRGRDGDAAAAPFAGLSLVVTGKIEGRGGLTRSGVQQLVEQLGGRLVSAVTGKTDLVVAGTNPGQAKLKAAAKLGVDVINEAELWRRVDRAEAVSPQAAATRPG